MRHFLPVVALLLVASAAVAQPVRKGPPIDLVAAPPRPPVVFSYPLWGGCWGGFYSPGFYYPPPVVMLPPPQPLPVVNPARSAENTARAAALAPAFLTLELPAVADVWLDGERLPSATDSTRTLQSAPLKLGAEHTFRVHARWTENGTAYEATPTSTVRAGERGKLTVYSGTPVK